MTDEPAIYLKAFKFLDDSAIDAKTASGVTLKGVAQPTLRASAGMVCASGRASHGGFLRAGNKLSVTVATGPGRVIFLSYIAVPDRLDSARVLRLRRSSKFQVPSFKLKRMGRLRRPFLQPET
jgi:hypothetical protein